MIIIQDNYSMLYGNIEQFILLFYVNYIIKKFIIEVVKIVEDQFVGRYEFFFLELFFMISEGEIYFLLNCKVEFYKKYIDVQILLSGYEEIGYFNKIDIRIKEFEYFFDDIIFFECVVNEQFVILNSGDFVFFYFNQVYCLFCMCGKFVLVKKVIVKILVMVFSELSQFCQVKE